jgi:hypothetical protein
MIEVMSLNEDGTKHSNTALTRNLKALENSKKMKGDADDD